jgi:hypothetical protein
MKRCVLKCRWLSKALLGGALALLSASPVAAQGGGGGGPGGGGAGGGGGGGLGLGGPTLSGLGGTGTGGSTPLSTGAGRAGGTSSAAASPSTSNPYYSYISSPYAPGFGPSFKLAPVVSATSSTAGGSGGLTGGGLGGGGMGGGGMGGGGGSSSSTGFTSALNSTGTIQTLKAGSLNSPLYAVATSTTPTTGTTTSSLTGFTTVGTRRAPQYNTVIGFQRTPRLAPAAIQADLRQSFDRSPRLTNGQGIQIAVNGSTVVLQGTVPTIREKRVAEVLARMAPGVVDVRNQLQVPDEGLGQE